MIARLRQVSQKKISTPFLLHPNLVSFLLKKGHIISEPQKSGEPPHRDTGSCRGYPSSKLRLVWLFKVSRRSLQGGALSFWSHFVLLTDDANHGTHGIFT